MLIRLRWYVALEVLKMLAVAVAGVSAVVLIVLCVRLMHDGIRLEYVGRFVGYLAPFVLPFSIPCGVLIATVMGFGRLAGDNELTAVRSSGVAVWQVVWPVLALSLALTGLTALLNNWVLPWSRRQVDLHQQALLKALSLDEIANVSRGIELPPYVVHVAGVDPEDPAWWRHVLAVRYSGDHVVQLVLAASGRLALDAAEERGTLILRDGIILQRGDRWTEVRFPGTVEYFVDLNRELSVRDDPSRMGLRRLLVLRSALAERLEDVAAVRRPRAERRRLGAQAEALRVVRSTARDRRHDIEDALRRLDDEAAALREAAAAAAERIESLVAQAALRGKRAEQTEKDLEAVAAVRRTAEHGSEWAARLDERLAQARAERDAAVAERDAAAAQLSDLRARLTEMQARFALNRSRAEELRAARRPLQEEENAYTARIEALENRHDLVRDLETYRDVEAQVHFRLAQSVACLTFALLGIPLGILCGRGGLVAAFGVSFGVTVLFYYPVYTIGRKLFENGYLAPGPAMWLPNVLCATAGALLLWRALRR